MLVRKKLQRLATTPTRSDRIMGKPFIILQSVPNLRKTGHHQPSPALCPFCFWPFQHTRICWLNGLHQSFKNVNDRKQRRRHWIVKSLPLYGLWSIASNGETNFPLYWSVADKNLSKHEIPVQRRRRGRRRIWKSGHRWEPLRSFPRCLPSKRVRELYFSSKLTTSKQITGRQSNFL